MLPVEEILGTPGANRPPGRILGRSRQGRPLLGWSFGEGPRSISLIGGAHADEPVGPEMLSRWVAYLSQLDPAHPLLTAWRWWIVPHINPDGAAVNSAWSSDTVPVIDSRGGLSHGYRFSSYFESVVRERPGDDLEFGFPSPEGAASPSGSVRPEAQAVAAFLREAAPLSFHASFHSMAFGLGPWFLLDREWIDRTAALRSALAESVRAAGYRLHDVDRKGEKGFFRIAEGFCTRPDSVAMRTHFEERGAPGTASLFRPSSMEYARSLGGDPLTIVSEMPLFLVPAEREDHGDPPLPFDLARRRQFTVWAHRIHRERGPEALDQEVEALGIRPMPLLDQMRFQLAFLAEALKAVGAGGRSG